MTVPGSYANGFAPRDGQPLYPELWQSPPLFAFAPGVGPTGPTWRGFDAQKTNANAIFVSAEVSYSAENGRYAGRFANGRVVTASVSHGIGTGDFTMMAWVRPDSIAAAWRAIMSFGSFSPAFYVSNSVNSQLAFYHTSNIYSGVTLEALKWQHVVVRRTGTAIEFFVGGKKTSTGGTSATSVATAQFALGSSNPGTNSEPYFGAMDDVFVFRAALSDSVINLFAARRGIAYELAPRRRSQVLTAGGFKAYWAARKAQIIGGGV
jgi:hypothetical protein